MKTCQRVIFVGRVQGVGFRYTAKGLAQGFAVTGYVRNLPDGTVELVVEGEEDEVARYLEALKERMAGYIRDSYAEPCPSPGMRSFEIRY